MRPSPTSPLHYIRAPCGALCILNCLLSVLLMRSRVPASALQRVSIGNSNVSVSVVALQAGSSPVAVYTMTAPARMRKASEKFDKNIHKRGLIDGKVCTASDLAPVKHLLQHHYMVALPFIR